MNPEPKLPGLTCASFIILADLATVAAFVALAIYCLNGFVI